MRYRKTTSSDRTKTNKLRQAVRSLFELAVDQQTDGTRFVSPDGRAWLSLYRMSANREPIAVHMDALRNDGRITYLRREQTWIVVSGFKGNRIFYRKAILACRNREWHHLDFEYPAADKLAFDRVVTRASLALSAYENTACPR